MGTQAEFEAVMAQVLAAKLCPVIDSVYTLSGYCAALARLLGSAAFGKILVRVE